ncbi:MAG: hypothetical protein GPJ54_18365 [Candidatus Heimdallarchaeota archaeon]|nr:hypothetical protein [Candidatus Heimdallarchaeota archaeon]
MRWKESLLIFIFILNVGSAKGTHTNIHYEFEGLTLSNSGFNINIQATDAIIQNDNIARYNGNQGLLFKSTPTDSTPSSIAQLLQISFDQASFLSYAIFTTDRKPVIRLQLFDADSNIMMIDYMRNSFNVWQSYNNEHYYHVDIDIPQLEWTLVDRNVTNDVQTAMAHPQSPFSSFEPVTISFIEIYQDTAQSGYEEVYNCLDDISLSSTYTTVDPNSNPGVCWDSNQTTSSLTDSRAIITTTVTQSISSSNIPSLPVSVDLKLPLVGLFSLLIVNYKRRQKQVQT